MASLQAILIVSFMAVVFGELINRPTDCASVTDYGFCVEELTTDTRRACYIDGFQRDCCTRCSELADNRLPQNCAYGDRTTTIWYKKGKKFMACENVKTDCQACADEYIGENCCGSCFRYCRTDNQPKQPENAVELLLRKLKDVLSMV